MAAAHLSEYRLAKAELLRQLDAYEQALEAQSLPEPHLNAAVPAPFDDPSFLPSQALFDASEALENVLSHLAKMVGSPPRNLLNLSWIHHYSSALAVVLRLEIPDALLGRDEGVSVEELGKAKGINPIRLTRVLRLLANDGVFRETKPGFFANNRASIFLVKQSPLTSFCIWQTDFSLKAAPHVADAWTNPKAYDDWDAYSTAAALTYPLEKKGYRDIWDWAAADIPELFAHFNKAMMVMGTGGGLQSLVQDFAWEDKLPKNTTLVDVGGGAGALLLPLLKQYKSFKGVVEDQPSVVKDAEANFKANLPSAIEEQRVQFIPHDFFTPQPIVGKPGAPNTYLFRFICHDLPDHRILKVLKQQVDVMDDESRVVVVDTLVRPAVPNEAGCPGSGGASRQFVHLMDYEMVQSLNAYERSPEDFHRLFAAAGLEVLEIATPRSDMGIILSRKARK